MQITVRFGQLITAFIMVSNLGFSQHTALAKITINTGEYERFNMPVSVSLKTLPTSGPFYLKEIKEQSTELVPAQFDDRENRLYWILFGKTAKRSVRMYQLFLKKTKITAQVKAVRDDGGIEIRYANKTLLRYNSFPVELPGGIDSAYTRGAFIHPVKTLSGKVLSRIHPKDHYHHVGLWNPWTKVKFEGREIDFWNLLKKQGTVRFKNYSSIESGAVYGGFVVSHEHIDLTAPKGEKAAIKEKWLVKVYKPINQSRYLVDFTSVLRCASENPVVLMKYRYGGGIGFRATEKWNRTNSEVVTSEGKTRGNGDATRARWCNVFGTTDGITSGILFMCHPDNFSFPQPMRIWPENANSGNGDVYFQFCPIREDNWQLKPGKPYFQKYRLLIYDGELSRDMAGQLWTDYSHPPKITISRINPKE